MKKIIAFAGSNSSQSINHKLVSHVASLVQDTEVKVLSLTDFPLPMYGIDLEQSEGFPKELNDLLAEIKGADGLIISVNEHNGSLSAFFKNTLDWLTRIDYNFLEGKKVMLMSTSPGKRGGLTALQYISSFLPRIKAEVVASIPFPSFAENFSETEDKILNEELEAKINESISLLVE